MTKNEIERKAAVQLLHYETLQVMNACERCNGGGYDYLDSRITAIEAAIKLYKDKCKEC